MSLEFKNINPNVTWKALPIILSCSLLMHLPAHAKSIDSLTNIETQTTQDQKLAQVPIGSIDPESAGILRENNGLIKIQNLNVEGLNILKSCGFWNQDAKINNRFSLNLVGGACELFLEGSDSIIPIGQISANWKLDKDWSLSAYSHLEKNPTTESNYDFTSGIWTGNKHFSILLEYSNSGDQESVFIRAIMPFNKK